MVGWNTRGLCVHCFISPSTRFYITNPYDCQHKIVVAVRNGGAALVYDQVGCRAQRCTSMWSMDEARAQLGVAYDNDTASVTVRQAASM